MLDLELGFHSELSSLFDCKGLIIQGLESSRLPQINNDIRTAFDFEAKREDDAFAGIRWVGNVLALSKSKGCLPLLERLIVLICRDES